MLLPFDHSFVSELQQEGISRYDCDSQKCDIALRTICLKTFGGRSWLCHLRRRLITNQLQVIIGVVGQCAWL